MNRIALLVVGIEQEVEREPFDVSKPCGSRGDPFFLVPRRNSAIFFFFLYFRDKNGFKGHEWCAVDSLQIGYTWIILGLVLITNKNVDNFTGEKTLYPTASPTHIKY